ncbi:MULTISPECIES: hypothetical protein [Aliiglaciecola]|uniref:hypothetical protein n=1 Tax=Aliiglaciecola TaxID=1406885 RepID=UPI001C0A2339|nr:MULTISPECIES: hypothetical protein [Aliiglaciecola]MBU2878377.1 hypothetical protein [Aliiglaciecola lipolytica]MDO6711705.1 hypothetical protein [Aliiglaciecola sp. 2_MG-2023]MDO6752776.1 hypothetical protein [Aliiglaciecola sp. 1_MG-2023]
MKKLSLFLGYCCVLFSAYSFSCQYHDYGTSKIPQFPPLSPELHPVMLQHFRPPQNAPLNVTLSTDSQASAKGGVFTISYDIHPDYHNVKAEVVSSKGVKLLDNSTMYLTRIKGNQSFKYQALSDDTQKVRVRISAVRKDMPIIVEKRLNLSST